MDVWDADSVVRATRGLEAVYWVSPTAMDRDPLEAHAGAGRSIRRAVEANGIARVVFQSSVGAERRHGVGEIDGLAAIELELDASGAAVTHLRCGYFFTNLLMDAASIAEGALVTAMDVDQPLPWVAPEDIAAVAAGRLLSCAWPGRYVAAVHGPEDLSFADVAAQLEATLGHAVGAVHVRDEDVRAELTRLGLPAPHVEAIVQMTAGIRDGFTPGQERAYVTTTPTALRGWLAAHAASFAG